MLGHGGLMPLLLLLLFLTLLLLHHVLFPTFVGVMDGLYSGWGLPGAGGANGRLGAHQ